jgi:hypothetical protein
MNFLALLFATTLNYSGAGNVFVSEGNNEAVGTSGLLAATFDVDTRSIECLGMFQNLTVTIDGAYGPWFDSYESSPGFFATDSPLSIDFAYRGGDYSRFSHDMHTYGALDFSSLQFVFDDGFVQGAQFVVEFSGVFQLSQVQSQSEALAVSTPEPGPLMGVLLALPLLSSRRLRRPLPKEEISLQ